MTGTLQSHRPEVLLLKDDPVYPRFQPGNTVSHVDDLQSWGMVLSRRDDDTGTVIDVLWSRPPVRAANVPAPPPRRVVPEPVSAEWSVSFGYDTLRNDVCQFDTFRAGRFEESFDGEETFARGDLGPREAEEMCQTCTCGEYTLHSDGRIVVTRRGVLRHELPEYVQRDPPRHVRRYRHGVSLKPSCH